MIDTVPFPLLVSRLTRLLADAGASPAVAETIARNCAGCERDGALSHGVFRIPGYLRSLRSGWADGHATPVVSVDGAMVRVDAARGFAQPALAASANAIDEAVAATGAAVVAIRDAHHFSALWPDVEPFAERGLLAMTMVTGAAQVIPRGASEKMLGTNPFAFAAPVAGGDPFVFDFATSSISHGDLQLAARADERVPPGTGVGRGGADTTDPHEILDGGGLLPFGGHKGQALSMMVELLASGLTASAFSHRGDLVLPPRPEDGGTDIAGQFVLVIDPDRDGAGFAGRVRSFVDALRAAGVERMPGDRRYRNRAEALRRGIPVTPAIAALWD